MDASAETLIDLDAVKGNVTALRQHANGAALMAVVKSDGYGHGMIPAARAALAGGASWLGVVTVQEALALRGAGMTAPVLCLMGVPGSAHEEAVRREVDLSAGTAGLVEEIAAAARRRAPGPAAPEGGHRDVARRRHRPGVAGCGGRGPGRRGVRGCRDHGDFLPSGLRGHARTSVGRRPARRVPRRGRPGGEGRRPTRGAAPGQHACHADAAADLVRPGADGRRRCSGCPPCPAGHPAGSGPR